MNLNERIITTTIQMLMQMGVSSMTMEAIAKSCGISKRTLYEHFPDKLTLVTEALHHKNAAHQKELERIFNEAPNGIDALLRVYAEVRKQITQTSMALVCDIKRLYPSLYNEYEVMHQQNTQALIDILRKARTEGVVRDDASIEISVMLFNMSMRDPELTQLSYSHDIPLRKILDTLFINFLRAIASNSGLELIDEFISKEITENKIENK